MKRILVLTEVESKCDAGGKEKFNRFLISFLTQKGFYVEEYCLNQHNVTKFIDIDYGPNYVKTNFPYKLSPNLNWKMNKIDQVINEYCNNNHFDIIISNLHDNLRETKKRNNFIYILHTSATSLLGWNRRRFFRLKFLVKCFLGYSDQFKGLNHLVVPDKNTKEDLLKISNKYKNIKNIHIATWPTENSFNVTLQESLSNKKTNEVVWIGRIYNRQKNIKFLNKVGNELEKYKIKLNVFGDGDDKKYLKSKNIVNHGWLNFQTKKDVLLKNKAFLMCSNNEGASLVLYESLSCGLPIVGRKTFPSIEYLVNEEKNIGGILVDKNKSAKFFAKEINRLLNYDENKYSELVQNNLMFFKKNLDLKKFEDDWLNIISKIINNLES